MTGIVLDNGSLLNETARGASKSLTLAQNLAIDSGNTWAYLSTDEGSYYQQFNGNHYFGTTPSGTAGADATVTSRLTILNGGRVGIGTSSPSFENGGGLEVNYSAGLGSHLKLTDSASGSGGTNGFDLYAFNTSGYIENYEAGNIVFL